MFLQIRTIFCMREAVYISYSSRILLPPPRPLKRPRHFSLLFASFQLSLFGFTFGGTFGQWVHVPCRGQALALPCCLADTIIVQEWVDFDFELRLFFFPPAGWAPPTVLKPRHYGYTGYPPLGRVKLVRLCGPQQYNFTIK